MKIFIRAFLFACAAALFSMLADLAIWSGYQGLGTQAQRQSLLLLHGLIHGGVFVVALAGSMLSFSILHHRVPSIKTSALLGLLFGAAGLFFAALVIGSLGFVVGIIALFVTAVLSACAGSFLWGERASMFR